jgi:hypothetical protein
VPVVVFRSLINESPGRRRCSLTKKAESSLCWRGDLPARIGTNLLKDWRTRLPVPEIGPPMAKSRRPLKFVKREACLPSLPVILMEEELVYDTLVATCILV